MDTSNDSLTRLGLFVASNLLFLTLGGALVRLLVPAVSVIWVIPLATILFFVFYKKITREQITFWIKSLFTKAYFPVYFVILLGILAQNLVMFRGGWESEQGVMFPSMHDTMWSLAISGEFLHHFPAQHPGYAGEILKNHHYFYPLFLSHVSVLTGLSLTVLYFQVGPVLVSFLFGVSLYSLSTIFTKDKKFQALTIFLGYFSGSFAFFVPLIFPHISDWKGNTFLADQPFDQIINPYSVLGFALFLFGAFLLHQLAITKVKRPVGLLLLTSVFIGSLYGFKSFGGLIALCALFFTLCVQMLIQRGWKYVALGIMTVGVFVPVFFAITNTASVSLLWSPGWLLTELMVSQDKLNMPDFVNKENYYLAIGNTAGFLKIKSIELIVYIIGNFGIRLFGVGLLFWLAFQRKNKERLLIHFLFFSLCVSFFIPLFFNLGANAHNVVQFTPYSLLIAGIMLGVGIEKWYKKSGHWSLALTIVIVALAVPVNVKNILTKIPAPEEYVSTDQSEALTYLRTSSSEDSVVLIDPRVFKEKDPMYLSALSERRMYLASWGYAVQTGKDPKDRMEKIISFFDAQDESGVSGLVGENIQYVYIQKPMKNQFLEQILEIQGKNVFENKSVIIFQFRFL
jgi:hypothetical protein